MKNPKKSDKIESLELLKKQAAYRVGLIAGIHRALRVIEAELVREESIT